MKYRSQDIALALADTIVSATPRDTNAIIENFLAFLAKNGLERHGKDILAKTERLVTRKNGGRTITIETARQLDAELERTLNAVAGPNDTVTHRIEPDLIAGFTITVNNEMELDGSLKRKLSKLFA